nr:hypothetical protein 4 [bacterium]
MFAERDPKGLDQHTPGAKLDHGKPNLDLVLGSFAEVLMEVGNVGTYGALKYSPNGWLEVEKGIERYSSAMLRHYFASKGQLKDSDTDLLHDAHLAWNALARLQLRILELKKGSLGVIHNDLTEFD